MDRQNSGKEDRSPVREVVSAVLAGGVASRMNGEKAGAILAGRPLVEYPVRALTGAGLAPFLVTKADRPVAVDGVETVIEPPEPRHPLLGIATALRAAGGAPVLVVACDLPMLPSELLAWLAKREGVAVVPRVGGHLQPLAALYRPNCLEVLEAGLETGRSATATVLELGPVIVEEMELARFGDPEVNFQNVNTKADLARVERYLAGK